MPETVFGLPLHPLVVHGAIVLVPVAALLAVIVAVSQERRTRWGVLTWLLATAALGAAIAAKLTGETLETTLYPTVTPLATAQHADYGSLVGLVRDGAVAVGVGGAADRPRPAPTGRVRQPAAARPSSPSSPSWRRWRPPVRFS